MYVCVCVDVCAYVHRLIHGEFPVDSSRFSPILWSRETTIRSTCSLASQGLEHGYKLQRIWGDFWKIPSQISAFIADLLIYASI